MASIVPGPLGVPITCRSPPLPREEANPECWVAGSRLGDGSDAPSSRATHLHVRAGSVNVGPRYHHRLLVGALQSHLPVAAAGHLPADAAPRVSGRRWRATQGGKKQSTRTPCPLAGPACPSTPRTCPGAPAASTHTRPTAPAASRLPYCVVAGVLGRWGAGCESWRRWLAKGREHSNLNIFSLCTKL